MLLFDPNCRFADELAKHGLKLAAAIARGVDVPAVIIATAPKYFIA